MYDAGTTFGYQGLTYTVLSEKIRNGLIQTSGSGPIGSILASPMQLAMHESPYKYILIRIDDTVKSELTGLTLGYILDPDEIAIDENGIQYSCTGIDLNSKCCLEYVSGDTTYYSTLAGSIIDTDLHLS